jgi:hypothetical protein
LHPLAQLGINHDGKGNSYLWPHGAYCARRR